MKRRHAVVLTLVAVLAACSFTTPAAAAGETATKCTVATVLKAGNEVPPSASKAIGAALVHINGSRLFFSVAFVNPARETFVAGHIHVGAAGVNGPVVVGLFAGSTDRKLILQAGGRDIDADLGRRICDNPGAFYINYHTTDFPGGAIRGQLRG
jgi:hypothetical protein